MPSGTGKTVSLLSLIVSYQQVCAVYSENSWVQVLIITPWEVLSDQKEACLLFTYRPRNREGAGRAQAVNGISNQLCGNRRREGEGTQLHGFRLDKSEKSMSSPRST